MKYLLLLLFILTSCKSGIECIKIGEKYTLYGQEWIVGAGGGNRGRCGDKNFNLGDYKYTKDCLIHDTCERVKDRMDCLSEFWNAIDDFIFANCGG